MAVLAMANHVLIVASLNAGGRLRQNQFQSTFKAKRTLAFQADTSFHTLFYL